MSAFNFDHKGANYVIFSKEGPARPGFFGVGGTRGHSRMNSACGTEWGRCGVGFGILNDGL